MKQIWIDYLRVLAVFAVVTIHTTAHFYNRFNEIPINDWWLANVLNGLSRFAVPMFVMISGYLLLGRNIGVKEFYIKRGLRIFPAFIFWSLFFVVFDFFLNDRTITYSLWNLTVGLVSKGETYYHLWYLSMFICLILFIPFINNYILGKKPSTEDYFYMIGIFAFFMLLDQASLVAKELFDSKIRWFTTFPWFVAYLIAGYFIGTFQEKIRISNKFSIITLLSLLIGGIILNYYSAYYGVVKDGFILNNTGIINFTITLLIFNLFAQNKVFFRDSKLISNMATASFGIYLIHPVFLNLLYKPVVNFVENQSVAMLLLLSITFLLSFLAITFLRKIRLFNKIC